MADDVDSVLGAVLGIIVGLVGIAILATLLGEKRCPRCRNKVPPNTVVCPFCGSRVN